MSSREIARQWFIPGEGIDRHVISADIQRYLGNDATVRPGMGTGENEGNQGYWIKAYRNLTSAMISDLRADSVRWRQEQRATGTREPYEGSSTYQMSSAGRPQRRDGDSPSLDGPYGLPTAGRERLPAARAAQADRMDIDPPQFDRRYQGDSRAYPPEPRDPRDPRDLRDPRDPRDPRAYAADGRQYAEPQPSAAYGRQPVTSSYGVDPRYATSYGQANDGAPPGYVRQGQYYVPITSGYEQSTVAPSRFDPSQPGGLPYGQPAMPQGRVDPRDPRYGVQPDYSDPRYAYPSPAATVSSVTARDREPISSPQQASYGAVPTHLDQYGRPVQAPPGQARASVMPSRDAVYPPGAREPVYPPGAREPVYPPGAREPAYPSGAREPSAASHPRSGGHSSRDPNYGRDRPSVSSVGEDSHASRRRRMQ